VNKLKDITNRIVQLNSEQKRSVVAIAGPPGSGKSTLAEHLNDSLNNSMDNSVGNSVNRQNLKSCVMPMDGFHLDNDILSARGHLQRKGAPHTFDANGFVDTVARVHANEHTVYVPVFDRSRDIAVAGVQEITSHHSIILVEGNYLFLREAPWAQLSKFFSFSLFLNPGIGVIEERILARWQGAGLDQETINRRTYDNDIPNAEYVLNHSELETTTTITAWS